MILIVNNKIPKELADWQELQRQKTINNILRAIAEMRSQGYCFKIKSLIDFTGLSRSVFAKEHIRKILHENGIGFAKPKCDEKPKESVKKSPAKILKDKLAKKDQYITNLISQNVALKKECELLRGKIFLLMQRENMN